MEFHAAREGSPFLGTAPLLVAAVGDNLSVFSPASPPAEAIYRFFFLILAIVGLILVTYAVTLVYCIILRRGQPGPDDLRVTVVAHQW